MKKLFGTDGIRGVANKYPMTALMAMRTGRALAFFVTQQEPGFSSIVIGKDTRASGDMFEAALSAGIASMGVDVLCAGVIPTPGVAFLVSGIEEAGAGIVISASHNPYYDNGIKIFNSNGYKLSDDDEEFIEDLILNHELNKDNGFNADFNPGRISVLSYADEKYAGFLKNQFKSESSFSEHSAWETSGERVNAGKMESIKKLKIVVDCSNGAASELAPLIFTKPLFDTEFIFNLPDGKNINENCGSQHTEFLKKLVLQTKADIGLAFDGDADRLIALDENADKITGDRILAICANHAKNLGRLKNNIVVSTVMSNIGLARVLESLDIKHVITDVGDREVLKKMKETGAVMGGEDSGHMIFSHCHTTGDGILTALQLVMVMLDTGKKLSELASIMKVYPQILMNVEVDPLKPDFMQIKDIADEIKAVEHELGKKGRVLVRYSGTQPLLRVMVEGPDREIINRYCRRICSKVKQTI